MVRATREDGEVRMTSEEEGDVMYGICDEDGWGWGAVIVYESCVVYDSCAVARVG
jgi:hypothetical protein